MAVSFRPGFQILRPAPFQLSLQQILGLGLDFLALRACFDTLFGRRSPLQNIIASGDDNTAFVDVHRYIQCAIMRWSR